MQKLLEEVRGASHLLPMLPILLQGQGQGEDEDSQQGILVSVSYVYTSLMEESLLSSTTFHFTKEIGCT